MKRRDGEGAKRGRGETGKWRGERGDWGMGNGEWRTGREFHHPVGVKAW